MAEDTPARVTVDGKTYDAELKSFALDVKPELERFVEALPAPDYAWKTTFPIVVYPPRATDLPAPYAGLGGHKLWDTRECGPGSCSVAACATAYGLQRHDLPPEWGYAASVETLEPLAITSTPKLDVPCSNGGAFLALRGQRAMLRALVPPTNPREAWVGVVKRSEMYRLTGATSYHAVVCRGEEVVWDPTDDLRRLTHWRYDQLCARFAIEPLTGLLT